jgi:hypothetical protein
MEDLVNAIVKNAMNSFEYFGKHLWYPWETTEDEQ